ncbi:PAS domain S-box protein [Leptospira sp. 201903071]|uniref:PAS domain S-box protein n=1 Tax=Leptospira ainazelensis TaxID=2810034 RepID=UPI0019624601|nr:PAS domain S-box protein [Leptospira ainazelensis]MBM9500430.1 PAS domain S-box protein [Leptospira ainazelensis]
MNNETDSFGSLKKELEESRLRIHSLENQLRENEFLKDSLRKAEKRISQIIENSPDAIVILNMETGKFQSVNQRASDLFGYSLEEFQTIGPVAISPRFQEDGRTSEEAAIEYLKRASQGELVTFEWLHRSKSDEIIPCEVRLISLPGESLLIRGSILDIRDQKKIQDELKKNQKRLESAIYGGELGLWEWDIPTNGNTYNDYWAEMLGYKLDELAPHVDTWKSLLHPEDLPLAEQALERYMSGETPVYECEFRLKCKDGSWKWILTVGKLQDFDSNGKPLKMYGIHADIDRRKKVEQQLREKEAALSRSQKLAGIGSWEYDLAEEKMLVSEYLGKIYELENLSSKGVYGIELVHPDDRARVQKYFIDAVKNGYIREIEYRIVTSSGKTKTILNQSELISDEKGELKKIIGSILDVSEKRKSERLLQYRLGFETLTTKVSSEIINLPSREIPQTIQSSLEKLSLFLNMQRGNIVLYDSKYTTRKVIYEWIHPKSKIQKENLNQIETIDPNSYITGEMKAGRIAKIEKLEDLPFGTNSDRDLFLRNGFQSFLAIPLMIGGTLKGRLGFGSENIGIEKEPDLDRLENQLLRNFAEIIINALERKRVEDELKQERDLLSSITENSATSITVMDTEGKILYANKSSEHVLGVEISEITSRTYNSPKWEAKSLDEGEWKDEDQPFTQVMKTGEPVYDIRHAIATSSGEVKYLSINGSPVKNQRGEIQSLVFLITDITENVLRERALKASEERYRTVAEQTGSIVYDYDISTGKVTWAGAVFSLTGFKLEEFQNFNIDKRLESIHPKDLDRVLRELEESMAKHSKFRSIYSFRTKYGGYILVEDRGIFLYDGNNQPFRMLGAMIDIAEKKKAEEMLKDSEERLRLALNAANMGNWSWDINEDKITWSEKAFQIFRTESSRFKGNLNALSDLTHPEDKPLLEKTLKNLLNGKNPEDDYYFQHRLILPNDELAWIESKGKLYRDRNFQPLRIVGTVTDITERKKAEEELKTSEMRFQTFYQFSNEAIILLEKGNILINDSNPAFQKLFGYSAKEAAGLNLIRLLSISSLKDLRKRNFSLGGKDSAEIVAKKKNGTFFPAIVSVRTFINKGKIFYSINVIDTSPFKEAEELRIVNNEIRVRNRLIEIQKTELENTLENLKKTQSQLIQSEKMAALGQLMAGIAHEINNPIGAVQASNQNIQECLNRFRSLLPDVQIAMGSLNSESRELFAEFIEKAISSNDHFTGMEQRNRKKAITSVLESFKIPTRLAVSYADTLVDMGLGDLPAKFVPLLLLEQSEMILEYSSLESFFFRNTKTIQVAVDRISKILYALKNFSHFDIAGERILASVKDTIETVLTIYHNQLKKGVDLQKDFEEVPPILCFPDDLLHIWTNLIYNSLQAMQFKGTILIRLKRMDKELMVEVKDNGPGIPSEIQERIFEPFFTTKAPGEGSGLGLDIVKKIVQKHNGKIELESIPGMTSFKIYLPILTQSA